MIDPIDFQDLVIDPALEAIDLYSPAASELLLGTALQESALTYLTQRDGDQDPFDDAMGVFQTERKTIDDIWTNYLEHRSELAATILKVCGFIAAPLPREVIWNLRYAAIIARIHYRRVPEPLPAAGNVGAMANYWKDHYNTPAGHGTPAQYMRNWYDHQA